VREYHPRKHKQGATTNKWVLELPYKKIGKSTRGSNKWGVGTWSSNMGE